MNVLLKTYIELCLMRIGPQDIPSSLALRNLTIGLYILFSILVSIFAGQELPMATITSLLDTLFLILLAVISLKVVKKPERTTQTITALVGCSIIFTFAILPLVGLYNPEAETQNSLLGLFGAVVIIWNLMVTGHILRHALSLPLPAGIVIALAYTILIKTLFSAII